MADSGISLTRQVKSRLLPLPWAESVLEWLLERLPRKLVRVELEPIANIQTLNPGNGEYCAITAAPAFELFFGVDSAIKPGWYYLEAAITHHNGSREMQFKVVLDNLNEYYLSISCNIRGSIREVLYLPEGVTALYWLPTTAPGYFTQSALLLHKISALESFYRRFYRVLFDLWRFRNTAMARSVALNWYCVLGNLQDAYLRTIELRVKRLVFNDYQSFLSRHEALSYSDIQQLQQQWQQQPIQPLFTIILTVENPPVEYFKAAVDSVLQQLYPQWELLLVGCFAEHSPVLNIAEQYGRNHDKVKLLCFTADVPVTQMLNNAVAAAAGQFVIRMRQLDRLPVHCLCWLVAEINAYPDVELIYTDHDCINAINERIDPYFKPDWNSELFFSHDYVANLCVYRLASLTGLALYRENFAGAEDYDLKLRFSKQLVVSRIRHIPKILYHTRRLALTDNAPQATDHLAAQRALEDYFAQLGSRVDAGVKPGLFRIRHVLPEELPLVSILIPTRDRLEILSACIDSIINRTSYPNWEILVIDNQSQQMDTKTYLQAIQQDSRIRVINYDLPFNFSAINNFAAKFARGELLALLNNDVEVISEDWLTELVSHAIQAEVGAVGAKLLYANNTVQHAGVILGLGGVAGHAHKYLQDQDGGYCHRAVVTQNLSAVTGACLVVKKSCYLEVGGLDEENLLVALNDIDFCLKLRDAGYRNVYTPYAKLYHHESISRGRDDTAEKQAIFRAEFEFMQRKWGAQLLNDPAYNPNLTLEYENFSLSAG
jgi:GT2 family glycosyltransferase